MLDHLKSLLFASLIFCCSLLVIGYLQNFYLMQPVADLITALGFEQKTVGVFIFFWLILVLPNILSGVIIGKYVPLYRQLYISPLIIFSLFWVSGFMYLRSNAFIWVCDSWNLLFVTAFTGFAVGVIKRKGGRWVCKSGNRARNA